MSSHPSMDAGIPVLTEVIPGPPEAPAPVASAAATPQVPHHVAAHEPDTTSRSDAQWERLEREIREAVLLQVLERIDFVMEQRVRDSLADVLQIAVENLAAEIKAGLQYSIRDVVTRAVTQEIAKLQSGKNQIPPP